MTHTNHITRGDVLKYALLPGILPRLSALFSDGFSTLAYMMAVLYRSANILPKDHIYLQSSSYGRYGIRQVMAAAANHLTLDLRHSDQIIIFFAVLTGIVLLFLQFGVLLLSLLVTPALASGIGEFYAQFFVIESPANDLAFKMLDLTFGIPNIFGSSAEIPTSFHTGLHFLLQFYSQGMLLVGIIVIIYFIIAIVAETAQTGTPFGKRFNHTWVPVRLVLFFALLIPFNSGLNGAQLITLHVAKFGSNLATNGWIYFNDATNDGYLGRRDTLVAPPSAPEVSHIPAFMMVAKTCAWAYGREHGIDIGAYFVKRPGVQNAQPLTKNSRYQEVLSYFKNNDITIRFGEQDPSRYNRLPGAVNPLCGEMKLQITDVAEPGSAIVSEGYFNIAKCFWVGDENNDECSDYGISTYAKNYTHKYLNVAPRDPNALIPDASYKDVLAITLLTKVKGNIKDAVEKQVTEGKWERDEESLKLGWAGAALKYSDIAQQNATLVTAVQNTPHAKLYPKIMERTVKEKLEQEQNVTATERYNPKMSNGMMVNYDPGDEAIAFLLYKVWKYWEDEGYRPGNSHTQLTGNALVDAINSIFGSQGLFDMCSAADAHPLAQLSVVGKGLVESSVRNMGFSIASGIGGGLGKLMSQHFGAAGEAMSGYFTAVAGIGLLAGFLLFYVIPFMPFFYFFFAVGGWVKGIFEAMVGLPLWALAHLRIDSDGLPGEAAFKGYALIFEIFIRPILIVFGLLASVIIFTAMVKVLNETYHLAVSNLSGFNPETAKACTLESPTGVDPGSIEYFRGPIDQFFFTIMYVIIVYMIGMSAFKLIDLIPNQILRWIVTEVSSFNDQAGEPVEGILQKVTIGGGVIGSQLQKAGSQLGSAGKHAFNAATDPKRKREPDSDNHPDDGSIAD